MFTNTMKYKYNISLPATTSKEVIDWFADMENCGQLEEALIELVHKSVKTEQSRNNDALERPIPDKQLNNENHQTMYHDNLLDSLYNWQDSTKAIFMEAGDVKIEKKKMLSV